MIPPQVNGATKTGATTFKLMKVFPMIPPQVNGATLKWGDHYHSEWFYESYSGFPMIPPQVNGATWLGDGRKTIEDLFPMIPPQVNGATRTFDQSTETPCEFPMIPPQVNGATRIVLNDADSRIIVPNDSAPS